MQNNCRYLEFFISYIIILNKEFLNLIKRICDNCYWAIYKYKLYFYILITKLIFIVSYYFIIKKIVIKCSSTKVSLSLNKVYTSTILSSAKSFIKFTTSLLIYYSLFMFNTMIKNKKIVLKSYKKKITTNLFKVIYLLTLNTYKVIITDLKLDL